MTRSCVRRNANTVTGGYDLRKALRPVGRIWLSGPPRALSFGGAGLFGGGDDDFHCGEDEVGHEAARFSLQRNGRGVTPAPSTSTGDG
ncbi:MAG: hypothetical protein IH942_01470 [Acidobacteria bacterium]|nr:hypothetical protein [Acidobacteriota bacterium]